MIEVKVGKGLCESEVVEEGEIGWVRSCERMS